VTIHRDDLESKLREIETVVDDTQQEARNMSKWVIAGVVVLVVGVVAYRMWKRSQRVQVIVVAPQ